ncbi:cation-translocating P-type ATPase [Actinoallomurus rhizosphaericola]|uniref:cation-translocating P-type ATPase n=1 Tax=Actinoallomurus rhizosphaericola TaxID=2952536 RepID=UPI00209146DA|nr:cation-translocating P-type ATPase [Actinoallomurus rhizosphaericola]MCO5991838.1 cation-translocating P-type ATPase [Actinoallomurus rhizosphaericola]
MPLGPLLRAASGLLQMTATVTGTAARATATVTGTAARTSVTVTGTAARASVAVPGAVRRASCEAVRLPGLLVRLPAAAARASEAVVQDPAAALRAAIETVEQRRVQRGDQRTSIRVRGLHRPGREGMASDLVTAMSEVAGVRRAEVNGVLGVVMVAHDGDVPVDALTGVVDAVEDRYDAAGDPYAAHPDPGHRQAVLRETALTAAYAAGATVAITGRFVLRAVPIPPAVGTLIAMADSTPQVRDRLTQLIGRAATDVLIGGGLASLQALAQQPTGLVIGSVHRMIRVDEARGYRAVWHRRIGHLIREEGSFEAPALHVPERPVPLPYGPVERAAWTVPTAITGAVGAYVVTRDAARAQGVLAAGVPRAARMGREAFATQLGLVFAGRDIIVIDPESLRRFDRVDHVIVDASVLRTGDMVIEDVVPLPSPVTAEEAHERAHALVDLERPEARREDGPWAVTPLRPAAPASMPTPVSAPVSTPDSTSDAVLTSASAGVPATGTEPAPVSEADLPAEARARAVELRELGAIVLLLTRDGEPAALVSVVAELDPLAEALIDAARGVGSVAVAGASALAQRLSVPDAVPGGGRLLDSVRQAQEAGHVVALVAARGGAPLAAADVGIGLLAPGRRPPWGAPLLCGPGLAEACLLLGAMPSARRTSTRAARIANVGSVAGALLAAAGSSARAPRRARLAVDFATVSAFVVGSLSGRALTRRPAPVPQDRTAWHAWPAKAVLTRLGSSMSGIDEDEAARRRSDVGEVIRPPGLAQVTVDELDNPLTPALAAGAGVSAVVGSIMDAALIGAVLGVNAMMSGLQRVRADRALRQLVDLSAVRVRLRRPDAGGEEPRATADQLVPGDVVVLTAGDAVPADLRLLSAKDLEVDESSLTGESQLVTKDPRPSMARSVADRHSMLYQGTVIAAGDAVGVVVATGAQTEVGRTTRQAGAEDRPGGVETRLRALTRVTLPVALGAGAVLFGTDLLRGATLARALGPAVSLAVAAVPEGLPFVATAAELATARRMSRRGALVRNPRTIEALGRIDVLCFDKTGTLTEGRLRLGQVSDGIASCPVEERLSPAFREILAAAVRATPDPGGGRLPHPTDRAIMRAARKLGMDAAEGLGSWQRVDELPFEPARGYHAVLGRTNRRQRLSVKGAPEIILEACDTWQRDDGPVPFDQEAREKVDQEIDRLARLGYRVLAVAERAASGRRDLTAERIDRLGFLGLLCIADPVRPTAAEAVGRLRKAGVDVIMITGDHPTTAEAIAAELRLLNGRIMTGPDLDALRDEELADALSRVAVFARVSPAQKARVVRALRSAGRVVAVTGDGANDAPAIRLADVGIALGERATPAARETADVVVTDDRIETITDAIADCRAMWRSTRDALAVLLGGNLGEIAFTVGTGLVSGRSPLNVRQLLLVNLLTDMLPAIALAARPPSGVTSEELLAEGPDRSLGGALTRDVTVRAGTTAGAALAAWMLARASGTRGQADTTGLVALVTTQLAQTIVAGGRDPLVLGCGLASLGALAFIVQVPGLSHFFGCRPLLPHCWAIALGSGVGLALAAVLLTRIRRPAV